jgi:hypothetical protein
LGTKIAFSIIVILVGILLLKNVRSINNTVMERLNSEKRVISKIQKNNQYLNTFQSKIVTHVKASPADFCKILTNPLYYKNFKFNVPTLMPPV